MYSISPLVLPISAYPRAAVTQAAVTVSLTATGLVRAKGALQANESVAVSQVGQAAANGALAATASVDWSVTPLVKADGQLQAAESVAVTATATAKSGNLVAATSLAWSETAVIAADGSLSASASVEFLSTPEISGAISFSVLPWVLPGPRYRFNPPQPQALRSAVAVDFSVVASLTGTGGVGGDQIFGSTSIADVFNHAVWLRGRGQLAGAVSLAFSQAGLAKAVENNIFGATSVAWSETAAAGGRGQLQGTTAVAFSEVAVLDLIRSIEGAPAVGITATGTLQAKGQLAGLTIIRLLNPGMLITDVTASTFIGFTASAIISGGDFTKKAGQWYVCVAQESDVVTVEADSDVVTVVADPFRYTVQAESDTILVLSVEKEAA